jgi:hypothetical protein
MATVPTIAITPQGQGAIPAPVIIQPRGVWMYGSPSGDFAERANASGCRALAGLQEMSSRNTPALRDLKAGTSRVTILVGHACLLPGRAIVALFWLATVWNIGMIGSLLAGASGVQGFNNSWFDKFYFAPLGLNSDSVTQGKDSRSAAKEVPSEDEEAAIEAAPAISPEVEPSSSNITKSSNWSGKVVALNLFLLICGVFPFFLYHLIQYAHEDEKSVRRSP